ncbi:nuclease-related domain-containing protein [Neobacillus rhizosphaerae]|uniref:nuclease-related domain-containing protein n=1 Tax=Neobacillus rhizosphaerae TaxID=2880965 RepID=UPI003D2AE26A
MKNRDHSLTLEGLVAAQSRLTASHSMLPVLSAKQAAVEAGIGGEERVAEIFHRYSFSFTNHLFHDLSPSSDEKFQMDTVALTPWYGVVLEVKNISGVLEFKDNPPQLIRTREDGHQDGFESPVVQLERNQDLLGTWLRGRNVRLPIYGSVVLAYPKQIVSVPPAKTTLLFPNLLPAYIRSLPQQGKRLDPDTFHWLSAELLQSHQPFIPKPISEAYRIPLKNFKPGVRCGVCGRIGMVKLPRTWYCPFCEATDHLAHERNLREWFLIFKRTITNRECREFLGVDDIDTAKRILQSMDLTPEGKNRYRLYRIDPSKLIKKP